jgi:surface antigen
MAALRGIALAIVALPLAGCAGLGIPFAEPGTDGQMASAATTGPRLASAPNSDQVDLSDWDAVRRTIDRAPAMATRLAWSNAATGSVGSVVVVASDGSGCRMFATTVNDARGIRRYRGESCEDVDGHAQIHAVSPDDTTLL